MRQWSSSLHWSPQYQPFLEGCRLLGVCAVLGHTPCKELVTALIERWRPETNTFHLVAGEATITLEAVEVLTRLPTTGSPLIVSLDKHSVPDICQQWLGVTPPPNANRTGQLGFHGLRGYSIVCRMALQQMLLPILHVGSGSWRSTG
ncbi:Serine/threonine-protein phosphatase 7 long form homolog [Linum perenne]